jgi:hypothetical protein
MAVSCDELQYSTHCCASVQVPVHFRVLHKLVRAEAVALHCAPRHFEPGRPIVARTDAVHPVVIRREVASRPTQDGYVQVLDGRQHVLAESVGIGKWRLFVKHSSLDAAAQVLDEVSVDLRIDIADCTLGIHLDARV